MMKKVVGALVVVGSIGAGTAGVATAAPAPRCTHVAGKIARLQAEETQLSHVIASLQNVTFRGRHRSNMLRHEIAVLTRTEAAIAAQVASLQAQCPSVTGGTTTTTTTTTLGNTGTGPTGNTGTPGTTTFTGSV